MVNKKVKKVLNDKTEKIDTIYQRFFEKMKKLQNDRDKAVADLIKHTDKESIEKLKKSINDLYK